MMEDVSAENNTPTEEIGPSGTDQRMTNAQRAADQGQSRDSQPTLAAENHTTVEDASSEDKLPIKGDTAAQVTPRDETDSRDAIESNIIGESASFETQTPAGGSGVWRSTDAGSPDMRKCGTGADDSVPLNLQKQSTDNTATGIEAPQDQTQNEPLPVKDIGELSYGQGIQEPGTIDASHTQESNCLQQSNQSATTLCGINGGPDGESQLIAATESGSTQNTVASVETQPLAKKDPASQSTDMGPQDLEDSSIDAGQRVSTLQQGETDKQDCQIPGRHTGNEIPMHADGSIPAPMMTSQANLARNQGRRKRRRASLDSTELNGATTRIRAPSQPEDNAKLRRSKRLREMQEDGAMKDVPSAPIHRPSCLELTMGCNQRGIGSPDTAMAEISDYGGDYSSEGEQDPMQTDEEEAVSVPQVSAAPGSNVDMANSVRVTEFGDDTHMEDVCEAPGQETSNPEQTSQNSATITHAANSPAIGRNIEQGERAQKELARRELIKSRGKAMQETVIWKNKYYFIIWIVEGTLSVSVYSAFGRQPKNRPAKPRPDCDTFWTLEKAREVYDNKIEGKRKLKYKENKERFLNLE
jgi:hypothetical protein